MNGHELKAICPGCGYTGGTRMEEMVLKRRSLDNFRTLHAEWQQKIAEGYLWKIWVSSNSQNSRSAHQAADGQRVLINDHFTVAGEELLLPGDPKGSPENTFNCQCSVEYEKVPTQANNGYCHLSSGINTSVSVLDLVRHYFLCNGKTIRVSFDALKIPDNLLSNGPLRESIFNNLRKFRKTNEVISIDWRLLADFDATIFGNITLRLTGHIHNHGSAYTIRGRLAAFNDVYDFDRRHGERSLLAEAMTRVFSTAEAGRGMPFEIEFVGDRQVEFSGLWSSMYRDPLPPLPIPAT